MVDAGKMKEKPDKPFPELTDGQIRSIDYLFLTHCHTDHTGAIGFLEDRGFRGTIVGTSATLRNIPPFRSKLIVLEDYSGPNTEIRIHPELSVLWGRAGHCIGSVWYRFKSAGKALLFTGDYEEQSIAYTCDAIRDMDADLAVIDCAYGHEAEDAREHWVMLNDLLDNLAGKGKPLLFPVPSHGRGFDIIRMLSDRGITTVLTESLLAELWDSPYREVWLKEDFILAVEKLDRREIHTFESDYTAALKRGESFPTEYREAGIPPVTRPDRWFCPGKSGSIQANTWLKCRKTTLRALSILRPPFSMKMTLRYSVSIWERPGKASENTGARSNRCLTTQSKHTTGTFVLQGLLWIMAE